MFVESAVCICKAMILLPYWMENSIQNFLTGLFFSIGQGLKSRFYQIKYTKRNTQDLSLSIMIVLAAVMLYKIDQTLFGTSVASIWAVEVQKHSILHEHSIVCLERHQIMAWNFQNGRGIDMHKNFIRTESRACIFYLWNN